MTTVTAAIRRRRQSGTLDADGKLQITIPTRVDSKKQDLVYRIEARVTDAGNREISGHGFALATYGSFFLTAEPNSYVYSKGGTATITVTAQDYDKKPVQTSFRVEMNRWDWRKGAGPVVTTTQGQTDASGKAQVKLTIPDSGEFRVLVTATTPEKRDIETTAYLWAPGESALVERPRAGARADRSRQEDLSAGRDRARADRHRQGAGLGAGDGRRQRTLLRTGDQEQRRQHHGRRSDPAGVRAELLCWRRSSFAATNSIKGSKSLSVPPTQHQLNVQLLPSKPQYQPGEAASYTIKASDSSGKPVAAEFSLGVVDEAIYAIKPDTDGQHPERLLRQGVFAGEHRDARSATTSAARPASARCNWPTVRSSTRMAQLKPERLVQPKIRKAFPDTAYWVADIRTAGNGQATVKFDYPDAITSWRATTRGVTQDTKVGSAVENTIVRKNIMVRLVVPRFFRRGDEITLSTIVQNYLPTDKIAQVSMQFDGLQVLEGAQQDVNVPTRGLVKVDYRVRVLNVDSAKVLGKALTDVESDAMELTLPVVPFGVKLAISKSGSFAGAGTSDTSQPMTFPTGAEPGTRKLTISVMPSIAGSVFSRRSTTSPRIPTAAPSRPCRASCPTCWWPTRMQKLGVKSNIDPVTLHKQVQAGLDRLYTYQHRRRRLGMVADRRQPSLHDRLRARRTEPGEGRGLRREAGCDRQRPRLAAAGVRQVAESSHRSARLHGLCAGAERRARQRGARFGLEPALDAHRLWAGCAGTGDAGAERRSREGTDHAA